MFEWMPVLAGLCLGGLSIFAPRRRVTRFYVCVGILLIALSAVFLSGEWQQGPIYFALDLIEAFVGFAIAAVGIRAIRHIPLS